MKKTLRDRIAALAAMNLPALREEHRWVFGKEPVSAHRQFLFRKIAWRLQADEEGWQPDAVRELARGIARNSPLRNKSSTPSARSAMRPRPSSAASAARDGWRWRSTTTTAASPARTWTFPRCRSCFRTCATG